MGRANLDLFCPQVTGFSLPRMVGIIRFGIPTGDFSLKVSVHIDSNTSLILKPEKAVTLRIVEGAWVGC